MGVNDLVCLYRVVYPLDHDLRFFKAVVLLRNKGVSLMRNKYLVHLRRTFKPACKVYLRTDDRV